MFFSEKFNINENILDQHGALNISLECDLPFFIDPFLIFQKDKKYQKINNQISNYLNFLNKKSQINISDAEKKYWFGFPEIKNTWLGFSKEGNAGLGTGNKFANQLYSEISFAKKSNPYQNTMHIERINLVSNVDIGKDKISDIITNLIIGFLAQYTEKFVELSQMDKKYVDKFTIERNDFDYNTEMFTSKSYNLPFVINKNNEREYVLLCPIDILRKDELIVSKFNFKNSYHKILNSMPNDLLVQKFMQYVKNEKNNFAKKKNITISQMTKNQNNKIEAESFQSFASTNPKMYDIYIDLSRNDNTIAKNSKKDSILFSKTLFKASKLLISVFENYNINKKDKFISSMKETIDRIKFFKHSIENNGGYNIFYVINPQNKKKELFWKTEAHIQLLFKNSLYGVKNTFNAEVNNGNGQADFVISNGDFDKTVLEFKLASNSKFKYALKQLDQYALANKTKQKVLVIFFFNNNQKKKILNIIKNEWNKYNEINKTIFMIDCSLENKISASKVV